jgi:DNA-binding NarL/FixJ family response regulator
MQSDSREAFLDGLPRIKMVRTLIVEDNRVFRQTLRRLLSARFSFMSLQEADDGQEAMAKIEAFRPQIVFMDIKLPNGNGLDLTRKIKASSEPVIVIVLTSYDLPEYRKAAHESGADHFISKGSSTTEEILSLIDSILPRLKPSNSSGCLSRKGRSSRQ